MHETTETDRSQCQRRNTVQQAQNKKERQCVVCAVHAVDCATKKPSRVLGGSLRLQYQFNRTVQHLQQQFSRAVQYLGQDPGP
jgi:hypothetical protein